MPGWGGGSGGGRWKGRDRAEAQARQAVASASQSHHGRRPSSVSPAGRRCPRGCGDCGRCSDGDRRRGLTLVALVYKTGLFLVAKHRRAASQRCAGGRALLVGGESGRHARRGSPAHLVGLGVDVVIEPIVGETSTPHGRRLGLLLPPLDASGRRHRRCGSDADHPPCDSTPQPPPAIPLRDRLLCVPTQGSRFLPMVNF